MDVGEELPGGNGAYELQMKIRTKTVRLVRKKMYDTAINVLDEGANKLLDMKEEGSACDITEYLMDVYLQSDAPMDENHRNRIMSLLSKFTSPYWRRKPILAASKWAVKATGSPLGDAKLCMLFAKLYIQGA